jgi:hypothetical protein
MKRDPLKQFVALRESLLKRKAALDAELAQINAALGEASPAAVAAPGRPGRKPGRKPGPKPGPKPGRKRAQNAMSLKEAVLAATKSKPLTKADILSAVDKQGYVFTAKDPTNSLNTLLYGDKAFKNHGDGKFGPA